MTAAALTPQPLTTSLKHLGLSGAVLAVCTVALVGGIQWLGDARDAGPSVTVEVPRMPVAANRPDGNAAPSADQVAESQPEGLAAWFPWRSGAMTPWTPGTPPPPAPDVAEIDTAARAALGKDGTPSVTSPAAAASAEPAPGNGPARVMTPGFGRTSATEIDPTGGVRVIRPGTRGTPLVRAPVAGLHEQGPGGLLPIVAADGRSAFSVYRRTFTDTGRPKIALVVGGLGLNARVTQRAIEDLPPEVTLSFVPYAENLQGWIDRARADGHEVILEIPMEPFDYPENDPGPHTLLGSAPADENRRRLEFLLSRASGYFAVTNYLGGKFAQSGEASSAAMLALRQRGLGFVSDGSTAGLAATAQSAGVRAASADRAIDQRPAASDVASQLGALEAQATQRGSAMGFGVGYSVTIEQIARWSRELERRGIALAPASALAQ
jgi:uncharacterized protein